MSFSSAAKVYVISRPTIDLDELQRFLHDRKLGWLRSENASPAEEVVEICGRICYMSFSSDMMKIRHPVGRYIRNLIDKGHESVLEHVAWTFIIDQISRSFTHQLVRHRVGLSYSQLSQQYHEEDAATFVEPLVLQDNPQIRAQWLQSVRASKDTYRAILAALSKLDPVPDPEATRKIRSAARSVLPNATTTTIAVTANCRALRHLFRTRGDILGDSEMRSVVIAMYELVLDDAPALFPDFKLATTPDGVGALKHFPAGGS